VSRIYVVDDEPDMVELLATVLKGEGHEVETYTDGRAALARVLEEPPELLLLDLANAYIYKPFSPRELAMQVRQLLEEEEGSTSG